MTWFRAGGAGIPSALKAGMNAVLNKKFGTSTTYPPTGWPDDVNLMGPLPEKTASGSIASFFDGADDVPVKSAKFYFLPIQASGTPSPSNPLLITGWTGLTAYHQKKNLLDDTKKVAVNNNIWIGSDNPYTLNDYVSVTLNAGTYTFSVETKDGTTTNLYVALKGSSEYIARATNNTSVSFTLTERSQICVWCYKVGYGTDVTNIKNAQIEFGSTATSYEAYQTPTSYPVSWQDSAGTLYGGYVDATRGKVVKTHESVNFNDQSLTWTYQNDYGRFLCQNLASDIVHASSNSTPLQGLYSESYQTGVAASSSAVNESISCSTLGYLFVYDSGYSDVNTWLGVVGNSIIIYPLQTPEEYDITAFIPSTYLGSNNFYSDANVDTEITYRADISLLLASLQSNRSLSMMRTIGPEEVEQVEEEPEPEEPEER